MIVRELVTLLSFKKGDEAPLKQYGDQLRHLARLAAEFFAIRKAVELVRSVTELSDEWATVSGRVGNVVEGLDEQHRVLDALQLQSEKTGQSYETVGSLFAMLKTTGSSLGYTTDQVLQLSGAISQLVTLGGGTAAGAQRGMVQIEEMFSLGVVQTQHLRALMIDIPGAIDVLSASLKGGKKEFMDMVAAGTMTSKMFGELFLKSADEIERRFGRMPLTFARAFTTVRNYFGRLIADIGEGTDIWVTLAQAIIDGGRGIVNAIRWVERATGSWTNALKAAGIALMALVGPSALRLVIAMVRAMRALTLASIGIALPWYLLVGLIALVGLALEDLVRWFQGKSSLTERMIGPYSEWKGTIDAWKDTIIAALKVIAVAVGAYLTADLITALLAALGGLGTSLSTVGVAARGAAAGLATTEAALISTNTAALGLLGTVGKLLLGLVGVAALAWAVHPTSTQTQDQENKLMGREPGTGPMGEPPGSVPSGETRAGQRLRSLLEFVTPRVTGPDVPTTGPLLAPRLPGDPDARTPSVSPLFLGTPNPANFVPPSAMAPPNVTNTTNNDVRAPISVTVNSASDTPQAIGAAAGEGARRGTLEGWARTLGVAAPQTEFGLAY